MTPTGSRPRPGSVRPGTGVDEVADAVRTLADAGYHDSFVDQLYVASDLDDHLDWMRRLLPRSSS